MRCSSCGKTMPNESNFCNHCGRPVANVVNQYGLPQDCALCEGRGKSSGFLVDSTCTACEGKGSVLVVPPAKKCALCGGRGKQSGFLTDSTCTACNGTGWAHILK